MVACQNERSQHQNKAKAMQILAAKLAERARAERQAELDALGGERTDNAWGNQIRSYVLAPYQLVKDLRTDVETGNVDAVLDGDLDAFMEAELAPPARRGHQIPADGGTVGAGGALTAARGPVRLWAPSAAVTASRAAQRPPPS